MLYRIIYQGRKKSAPDGTLFHEQKLLSSAEPLFEPDQPGNAGAESQ
jgi:hypothetical protein